MSGSTTAPRTGPMATPKSSVNTYKVSGKTRSRCKENRLAAMPSAAFCTVPPRAPAMTLQTIKVAKFWAKAWGMRKMTNNTYAVYSKLEMLHRLRE